MTKTRKYEVEFVEKKHTAAYGKPVRAESAAAAAGIVGRRMGCDSARAIGGSLYQTVTCVPGGGMNLGTEFWISRID